MNNTILYVGLAVVAAALGFMLLSPTAEAPVTEAVAPVESETMTVADTADAASIEPVSMVSSNPPTASSYRQPVATTSAHVSTVTTLAQPCTGCGTIHSTAVLPSVAVPVAVPAVAPCGRSASPSRPCAYPSCTVCQRKDPYRACGCVQPCGCGQCTSVCEAARGCETPGGCFSGCGAPTVVVTRPATPPCGEPVSPCAKPGCLKTCQPPCLKRAGINRNLPVCFDECSMVQLHATVPHPLCNDVRFEWSANGGNFLNPTSSDPLYFTPVVRLPGGQDVVITLTITDTMGRSVTDHIVLHVRNTE